MKITLWYESHNAHERLAAKYVAARFPNARLVDVSTWTAMRDRPSESGWPDRTVRAFPCLVFDTEDSLIELERVEEVVKEQFVSPAVTAAEENEATLPESLQEASERNDVPGRARPILISELLGNRDGGSSEGAVEHPSMSAPATATVKAATKKSPKSPKKKA